MATDLGPVLAAVRDEWEHAIVIADRAGIGRRGAGQKLMRLVESGFIVSKFDRDKRLRVYRNVDLRGFPAEPLPATKPMCARCGKRPGTRQWGDALAMTHGFTQRWCEVCGVDPLRVFAEWVVSLDDVDSKDRQTVTLTKIIGEAQGALASRDAIDAVLRAAARELEQRRP